MGFADTRIYQVALEIAQTSQAVSARVPGHLADQMRRAATSIVLNFAEGCGKTGARDRRRFFGIAKGSAYEVTAAADVARVLGYVAAADAQALADRCDHVCAMLSKYR